MDTDVSAGQDETEKAWRTRRNYSKSNYFKMKKAGLTPELLIVPGFNTPRITPRADREWEKRMAALAQEKDARLERQRRVEHARLAGRAAARSEKHVSKRRTRRSA
jgi:primosomal protein N''